MIFDVIPNEQPPKVKHIGDFEEFLINNKNILKEFKDYAKTRVDAVGLAANQCSVDGERFMVRVFAIRNLLNDEWSLILNPIIIDYIGVKEFKIEGCLTWKNKVIIAERSPEVRVKYYDEDGNPHINIFSGFVAQIWQHEINHLNGIEEYVKDNATIIKQIKINRNDLCSCGSGKKYKKCCLKLI